jgi:sarcosine oxidase subunit gamma
MAEVTIRPGHAEQRSIVRLRVRMADASRAAVALGLPTEPLTSAGDDPAALWVSPDQWLLLSDSRTPAALAAHCQQALGDILHNATDSSDALACFLVEGRGARALLAMASGVDFDAGAFPPGSCVRTKFAKVAVLIRATGAESFDLFLDRSAAHYLEQWLRRAARDPLVGGRASA